MQNTMTRWTTFSKHASLIALILFAPALAAASVGPPSLAEARLAYLDPGTGSFIIQAAVAAVAGVAVTLRVYWHKIMGFFGSSSSDEEEETQDQ